MMVLMSTEATEAEGLTEADAVPVKSVDEEYRWLVARPCGCGASWTLAEQALVRREGTDVLDRLAVECAGCKRRRLAFFRVDTASVTYRAGAARAILNDQVEAAAHGHRDDDWVMVGSVEEAGAWLDEHPCSCGGPWNVGPAQLANYPHGRLAATVAICTTCSDLRPFVFALPIDPLGD
jgi:hypothetical protein